MKKTAITEAANPLTAYSKIRISPASAAARAGVMLAVVFLFTLPASHAADKRLIKHYGLIFGTVYGPDDHSLYGAKIEIHPEGKKHPNWELMSDHRGEFAQRVPPGPADYVITGEVEYVPVVNGVQQKKKKLKAETKVHIQAEERQDVSLHFADTPQ
jgi:hypothetical protein